MERIRIWQQKAEPFLLTALRLTVGVIMVVHGWGKLTDIEGTQAQFAKMGLFVPDLAAYLAVGGEVFGGLGLIVGALTPLAAFGVACTMFVAVFFVHLENGLLAKEGGFEYPLTLLAVALFFVVRGGGPFSVDALVGRLRSGREPKQDAEREHRRAPLGAEPVSQAD